MTVDPQDVQNGFPARPQGAWRLRRTLSGTSQGDMRLRTTLETVFNILLHGEDDFAKELPFDHPILRLLSLLKWERAIDYRNQSTLSNQFRCLHQFRMRAHIGPFDRQLAAVDIAKRELHISTGRRPTSDQAPALRERLQATVPDIRADMFDHDIDTASVSQRLHVLRKLFFRVVDHLIGAQRLGFGNLLVGPDGRNHMGSSELRHLDSHHPYAAPRADHQHRFTILESGQG